MRRPSGFVPLCLLFFASGVCGLTYQVLWLRLLALVFGVTVHAASTVLASFMAGLALGAVLAERLARRGQPLRVFSILEAGIAASALSTPALLALAAQLYRPLSELAPDSLALLTVARFVCSSAVLLVPTVLMGATLPVLSHAPIVRTASGPRLGALYAVNTAGALTGALLTGYVLIGGLGIQRTFYLAAALNLLVAAGAWWLGRREGVVEPVANAPLSATAAATSDAVPASTVLVVMAVSGFASLALEIVWFRILVQFLPATIYAFTTMLATVLAGIAGGSALAARHLATPRAWGATLAWVQGATSIVVLLSLAFLGASYAAGWQTSGLTQAAAAAILPASLLMGYAFPVALTLWTRTAGNAERPVGVLYSANVLGGIAGAVVGGFVLLPRLGSRRALIALAALYLLTSLAMFLPRRRWVPALALAALFAGAARLVPDPFDVTLARRHGQSERIFWREEGVQTSVSIHTGAFRGWLMYLDGLHQASDAPEMVRLHRLIGHLPMVLHPNPKRSLVVGLGGGATPGAVSQHDTRVTVIELSDSVRKGAEFFRHVNYDVLNRENVTLRVDDGRNFLARTRDRFDVATADLIQPEHAGAGNLYSRQYFTLVRNALADGGLALQWIGHRSEAQYKLIMRTFLDVFPHTTLWLDGQLMVGSMTPLTITPALVDAKRARPETRLALDEVGLDSFATLASWYVAGPDELRAFVGDGPVLTDDRPIVEYYRSLPAHDPPVNLAGVRGDARRIIQP
ncbi:MAG: fused MFS/spermidine synthase [Acidobacteria bacterium]|nr:fused MFS/spermidine synthase [Acidobacteriota bacterium]